MHHPTDRIAHTTAFVIPVMEHCLILNEYFQNNKGLAILFFIFWGGGESPLLSSSSDVYCITTAPEIKKNHLLATGNNIYINNQCHTFLPITVKVSFTP